MKDLVRMVVLETGIERVKAERDASSKTSPYPADDPVVTSKYVGMRLLSVNTSCQSSVITLSDTLALTASGCPVIRTENTLRYKTE